MSSSIQWASSAIKLLPLTPRSTTPGVGRHTWTKLRQYLRCVPQSKCRRNTCGLTWMPQGPSFSEQQLVALRREADSNRVRSGQLVLRVDGHLRVLLLNEACDVFLGPAFAEAILCAIALSLLLVQYRTQTIPSVRSREAIMRSTQMPVNSSILAVRIENPIQC